MNAPSGLLSKFRSLYNEPSVLYRAPGRVNLIGEHTDYNGGFVLPAAIAFSCWVAGGPRDDQELLIYSDNFHETARIPLQIGSIQPTRKWSDYSAGVAAVLLHAGYRLRGANLCVESGVPLGAGLSSSAAFEVAVAGALLEISGYKLERERLATISQQAENEFVGVRCGIMDQFVCCHGRTNHALLLDCRSLAHELVPVSSSVRVVVCNTMIKHAHGEGEYNKRRRECDEAVRLLAEVLPGVHSLRDVMPDGLEKHRGRLPDTIYRRARHVVTENSRVPQAALALQEGNLHRMGKLMADSHRSLRDDFQVSCAELDLMVELAARQTGVYGSRMTGGGFGGCTVNLVDEARASEFKRQIAASYREATGRDPDVFVCEISNGVERIALTN